MIMRTDILAFYAFKKKVRRWIQLVKQLLSFFYYFLSSGEGSYFDTTLEWVTSLLKELRRAKRFIFLEK